MRFKILYCLSLLTTCLVITSAPSADQLLTEVEETLPTGERVEIGRAICGDSKFNLTDTGLNCRTCPDYTGQPGDTSGLTIENIIKGNFTDASRNEILLDTSGCEAHYANFGGAILLRRVPTALSSAPQVGKSGKTTLEQQYYLPGYRLNDCLTFNNAGQRTLLVCNEYWIGQGEMIGHISAIEIFSQTMARWRLLRWYDNASTDADHIISVMPESLSKTVSRGSKNETIEITLGVIDTTRSNFEKDPDTSRTRHKLVFVREGQRFFADDTTRKLLGNISTLTRNVAD